MRQVAHSDWFSWFSFRFSGFSFWFTCFSSRFTCFSLRFSCGCRFQVFGLRSKVLSFRFTGFSFRLTGFGFRFTAFCFRLTDFSFRLIAWPPFRRQARGPVRWRYWSTSTHWVCVPLVVQARTCYSSCFRSTALSSSLLLSGFHLGAISLRFHPVSFHAAVCCQARGSYIVPGATLLGAVPIWYTVNRLLQQNLATQAASVLRIYLCLPFLFFFFSFFSLLLSRGLPPRMHIKLPWGHLSMAGGLAEGN